MAFQVCQPKNCYLVTYLEECFLVPEIGHYYVPLSLIRRREQTGSSMKTVTIILVMCYGYQREED